VSAGNPGLQRDGRPLAVAWPVSAASFEPIPLRNTQRRRILLADLQLTSGRFRGPAGSANTLALWLDPRKTERSQSGTSPDMDLLARNNVHVSGRGEQSMVFAHGFGCDQNMWRFVAPEFEGDFKVVLFDHVGAGGSDLTAYEKTKYSTLHGYADDLVEIGRALGLKDAVFVGHSVSAMIGVLASLKAPDLFGRMVLVGPSARYIDDGDYVGGFSEKQIAELLEFLEDNHMGWSAAMAPSIMGNPDRPELGEELTNSFCRTDPEIAKAFARVTFTSDNRGDLAKVTVPTLILQCSEDIIASEEVGKFVRSRIPGSELVFLKATGHCPNLSAPAEVVSAIRAYV
jgi:sigma-B regulation protein RsbQ